MGFSWYQLVWLFFIYGFLGWCCEVVFATLESGKFVNRGFLNGPICPIYGVGMIVVVVVLTPLQDNVLAMFVCSSLLASLLELVTGYLMEKFFDDKWWDYSDRPFNIGGYICLQFSILWGLACLLVMEVFHPLVMKLIHVIPYRPALVALCVIALCFLSDLAVTLTVVLKLKKKLRRMEELTRTLRRISDRLGEELSDGTLAAMEKGGEIRDGIGERYQEMREKGDEIREDVMGKGGEVRAAVVQKIREQSQRVDEVRQQYEQLREKLRQETQKKTFGQNRLVKAFPHLKRGHYAEMLRQLVKRNEDSDEK